MAGRFLCWNSSLVTRVTGFQSEFAFILADFSLTFFYSFEQNALSDAQFKR